jgi:hypothetical protein
MALLQDIVASVLQDVLSAQHQANLIAESLAEEYASSPVLKSFPVPAVSVGEMEITLNFAIVGGEKMKDQDAKSMEVIVDSNLLAAMGKDSLQSITLKISAKEMAAAQRKMDKE